MKLITLIYTVLLGVFLLPAKAQSTSDSTLFFSQFLNRVAEHNIEYVAEKFNIKIAEVEVINAGMMPDPELNFDFADNSQRTMQLGRTYGGGLDWTVEMGGKRKSRIEVARAEKNIAELALIDYFQNLRAKAALLYAQAMGKQAVLKVQKKTYDEMLQLSLADSVRHDLGEISAIDAEQSRLEVYILRNEIWQAETDWINSFQRLFVAMGSNVENQLQATSESFELFDKNYLLPQLIETALENRIDLALAEEDVQLADKFIQLAQANRKIDLGISLGIERNTEATNEVAETPAFTAYQLGLSIPLKVSNRRSSELKIAKYENQIKQLNISQLKLEIENEVNEAYNEYITQQKQTHAFENDLNKRAKSILDGKIYSYHRGEISLLEVINAQRTYNDVIADYYLNLYERAVSFINLQRICGMWDTEL